MTGAIHKHRRLGWTVVFLMISTWMWNGCILLPVPVNYHTRDSRRNVRAEDLKWLVPSETTRREVVLRLGEPDLVTQEETRVTYSWKKVQLQLYFAVYGGTGGGRKDYGPDYALELTFDKDGRLMDSQLQESKWNTQAEW